MDVRKTGYQNLCWQSLWADNLSNLEVMGNPKKIDEAILYKRFVNESIDGTCQSFELELSGMILSGALRAQPTLRHLENHGTTTAYALQLGKSTRAMDSKNVDPLALSSLRFALSKADAEQSPL